MISLTNVVSRLVSITCVTWKSASQISRRQTTLYQPHFSKQKPPGCALVMNSSMIVVMRMMTQTTVLEMKTIQWRTSNPQRRQAFSHASASSALCTTHLNLWPLRRSFIHILSDMSPCMHLQYRLCPLLHLGPNITARKASTHTRQTGQIRRRRLRPSCLVQSKMRKLLKSYYR